MYVDSPDLVGLVGIYTLMILAAFLWWSFTTTSKNKLLDIFATLALFGLILSVAGGVSIFIDTIGPLIIGEIYLIVGAIISIIAGAGWLLLRKEAQ